MWRLWLGFLSLFFLPLNIAHANFSGIETLAEQYYVGGYVLSYGGYSETDSISLSSGFSHDGASANSSADATGLFAMVGNTDYGAEPVEVWAEASYSLSFTPNYGVLDVYHWGTAYRSITEFVLTDITAGTTLVDTDAGSFFGSFVVDPSHTYSLYHYLGEGGLIGFDLRGYQSWVSIVSVPAPSAVLLGIIGATLVGWLRRRRSL